MKSHIYLLKVCFKRNTWKHFKVFILKANSWATQEIKKNLIFCLVKPNPEFTRVSCSWIWMSWGYLLIWEQWALHFYRHRWTRPWMEYNIHMESWPSEVQTIASCFITAQWQCGLPISKGVLKTVCLFWSRLCIHVSLEESGWGQENYLTLDGCAIYLHCIRAILFLNLDNDYENDYYMILTLLCF